MSDRVRTRSSFREENVYGLISDIEPKDISQALQDDGWIQAMQEELNQFERSQVWTLVSTPHGKSIIGTKWFF